jgi:hypothetical protein
MPMMYHIYDTSEVTGVTTHCTTDVFQQNYVCITNTATKTKKSTASNQLLQ